MDYRRARLVSLILVAAGLVAAAPSLPLRAARWLPAGGNVVEAHGREPAECLSREDNARRRDSVAVGRAAFRSPLLLGGQAARAGLSCNACHINGHGNPRFVFPGLSGAPGTADVTSSLMSKVRGDGTVNPKPIPSLYAAPKLAPHDRETRALEAFIRALVVDEFDGAEPPPAVLSGLADYVRALSDNCTGKVDVTLAARIDDVRGAAASASVALASGDPATARIMILAARDALGRIAERFPRAAFASETAELRVADLELAAIAGWLAADPVQARQRLASWRAGLGQRLQPLARVEAHSLFSHDRLENWRDGR